MLFHNFLDIEIWSYSRDISHFLTVHKKKGSKTAAVVSDVRMPEIKRNNNGVKLDSILHIIN